MNLKICMQDEYNICFMECLFYIFLFSLVNIHTYKLKIIFSIISFLISTFFPFWAGTHVHVEHNETKSMHCTGYCAACITSKYKFEINFNFVQKTLMINYIEIIFGYCFYVRFFFSSSVENIKMLLVIIFENKNVYTFTITVLFGE